MATCILVVDDSPTIRAVVSMILERSGYVAKVASDGQDAYDALVSAEVKADLVLVDFVMPRMNGYQLCLALRQNAELAATPIVLMSAKGDRIRDQFVQQTGALDAITKPFDPQALIAVIENALRRRSAGQRSGASGPRLLETDTDDVTAVGAPSAHGAHEAVSPAVLEYETKRTHRTQLIAQKLASVVSVTLAEQPELASTPAFTSALAARLTSEAVLDVMDALGERGASGAVVLSGDLGIVPIGAILQLLQSENQTGVLVCDDGHAEIRTTFRKGAIDLVEASGAGDEFRLGRFFVEEGILTTAEIDEIHQRSMLAASSSRIDDAPLSTIQMKEGSAPDAPLAEPAQKKRPLGMALLAAGKIDEPQLRMALTRQSSELLYEVLRWPAGRFELRREPPSELADNAKLALPIASVVMEGFRRVDEWRVLERTLGSFDAVLVRDDSAFGALDIASLPSKEKAVLDASVGERTVREIIAASHLSSFDACRILVQFLEARALRRRTG